MIELIFEGVDWLVVKDNYQLLDPAPMPELDLTVELLVERGFEPVTEFDSYRVYSRNG